MTELEVLTKIWEELVYVGIGLWLIALILFLMLMFKNMGGGKK